MRIYPLILCFFLLSGGMGRAEGFSVKEIYERWSPAVVLIISREEGKTGRAGAGSVIRKDGSILTNAHVIFDKEKNTIFPVIKVFLKPEQVTGSMGKDLKRRVNARVLAYDQSLDLALLKIINPPESLKYIELADPGEIEIGEEVVAIGHPEQGGLWTLSVGRVSGGIDDFGGVQGKDVFQTDTSINRGNSGGPLLDKRGYLVAVNSNIARLGEEGIIITGVNFAIKSSVVKKWLEEQGQKISYGKMSLPKAKTQKPAVKPEDNIPTPKKPYDLDSLIGAAEEELEDLMEDMRMKIRGRHEQ